MKKLILIIPIIMFSVASFWGCVRTQRFDSEPSIIVQAVYDDRLRTGDEEIVISFVLEETGKTVSICVSEEGDYIVFRHGDANNIELEYPEDKTDSWNMFEYYSFSRYSSVLRFDFDMYRYYIYHSYYPLSDETYEEYVELAISCLETGTTMYSEGIIESLEGNFWNIYTYPRIKAYNSLHGK